jgi:PAS domain S-box-containing protein
MFMGPPTEVPEDASANAAAARYETLFQVSRAIIAHRNSREFSRVLATELRQVVQFDFMGVFLYDESSNALEIPVMEVIDGPGFALPPGFPVDETITWWIYHHQQPVVVSLRDTRFSRVRELLSKYGVRSACLLPLTTAHRRLGSLGFFTAESDPYTEEEVRFLSLVADQVALAIDNALSVTDRTHTEQELQAQRAQFEKLFELAPEAIALRDVENRVLRVNKEFTKLFGFTAEEALGRNINELIVPDDLWEESERLQAALKRGERVNAETMRKRKDGTRLMVSFVAAPVEVNNGTLQIYGMYRDITKRKRAEQALRRSEAYLAEGQRLSHTGSWARCLSTGEIFWSQEMFHIFGLDLEHTKPTEELFLNLIHPDDRPLVEQVRRDAVHTASDYEFERRIVQPAGRVRQIHVVGHPVVNEANRLVEFVGTVVDVTERHESRAALEKAFREIKALKDQLYHENVALREEIDETAMFEEIVGKSAVLRRLLELVGTVAPTDSTVLICGETGTGKELVARAIHNLSPRRSRSFVKLNCAAIPTGLLESELFGHERGAFTGAIAQRIGRFELANQGTVFLDEIGEIPLELQPKLLRVLQEREFERLGSSRTLKTDARLIAATNRDLAEMVDEQKFRSDLFYRLNVFPIRIPPLRERLEDIPLLVQHFVEQFARRMHKKIQSIPHETMKCLCEYSWPGNIRELQNVIERAVILSSGSVLKVPIMDLTAREIAPSVIEGEGPSSARRQQLRRLIDEADRKQILRVLRATEGRVGGPDGAAVQLGLKRTTLLTRMKKLGIRSKEVS